MIKLLHRLKSVRSIGLTLKTQRRICFSNLEGFGCTAFNTKEKRRKFYPAAQSPMCKEKVYPEYFVWPINVALKALFAVADPVIRYVM